MAFKDRLKLLRGERKITQEDLAASIGLPPSTIRRYESAEAGMPKNERLQVIADYFGCSVDFLLERTNDRNGVITEASLNNEDRKLLEVFRKLSPDDREYYLEFLERIKKE